MGDSVDSPLPIAATFSKDPKFWGKDFEPRELHRGYGALEGPKDILHKGYLSWVSALGANLLGYPDGCSEGELPANRWAACVQYELWHGASFSLPHYLERQVADKLVTLLGSRVPGWSPEGLGVRFGLSGSDACSMAIRLARAVRGHSKCVSIGYHGFHDAFVTPPAWGVTYPQYMQTVQFGALHHLRDELEYGQCAAVIIEQPAQDPPDGYWQEVRRLCTAHGALLILDEVVTWPRFAMGGAAELYGVEPDLMCLGKGLGNGIPISCIVGRREYFDWFARNDPCFVSSTGFANSVSLAAADSVLDCWNEDGLNHIWTLGRSLMEGLQGAGYITIGQPVRFLVQHANPSERAYFILRMRDAGILANRPWLVNLAHRQEDVDRTIAAARAISEEMARIDVVAEMKGRLPSVLFENR